MTADTGVRLAGLVRRLTEAAENEADARSTLTTAITQLLDTTLEGDLGPLVIAVTSCCPAFDTVGFLACDGESFTVKAALGLSEHPGRLESIRAGLAGEAVSSRRPVVITAPDVLARSPFPAGTRAACAVPLLGREKKVLGVALFGSRSTHELSPEETLLARIAGERAARTMELAGLVDQLARSQETARRTSGFHDQVLAIVGHDLRNPLGAIVMSAALLQKKGGLAGWQAKTVDRVRSSALRMGRIIDDLLSYTRTRIGGGIPIARRPTDLGEVTRKIMEELRTAHPQATVAVSLEGDLRGEWDGDRLEQVVSNLVSNAIDHGLDEQPIALALRGGQEEVEVEVANQGQMPREVLDHAFEAFHKGPEQTGRKASGLGLGLYIAREIVRRHGGEIAICCERGATRIVTRLPRRAPEDAPAHGEKDRIAGQGLP
jgi:signal transduction histidine kinase